jgi:putative membrane protein
MSHYAFSIHMALHLGVTVIAAPLIAIGLTASGLGFSPPHRPWIAAIGASLFEMVVVWGWHIPAPYEAAIGSGALFVLQQASFLVAGMLVWMVAFAGNTRLHYVVGTLAMLMTFMHMTMLGVLLAVAQRLLYSPDLCLGVFGVQGLANQQLGGALMAVGGGLPYLVGGTVLAYRAVAD